MRACTLIAAMLVVVAGCRKTNGAYCGAERPCGGGFACDLVAHECRAIVANRDLGAGVDLGTACGSCGATTPICVGSMCQSCAMQSDPQAACAMVSPATPLCMTSGQDVGSCVACRDGNDCPTPTMPVCDTTTHACRACTADSDCASLNCDMTPGSPNRGRCIPTSDVVYVDGVGGAGNTGLTPTSPLQKIMDGINKAWMPAVNRHYVHVAPNVYVENIVVGSGKTITLVGPSNAIIHFDNNNDALGVSGGGNLTVRGLSVTSNGPSGKGANGAGCSGATFTAYQTQFIGSLQSGIYANNCALLVDGVWVNGNSTGGIYVASGDFQIYNTIITHNGGSGFSQNGTGTTTLFINNTVADNTASGVGGVHCFATGNLVVKNSILYNNRGGGGISETDLGCTTVGCASDDPAGGPTSTVDLTGRAPGFKGATPSPDSYHLMATSPCTDRVPAAGGLDHDYDLQSRPDSADGMMDIGADEAY